MATNPYKWYYHSSTKNETSAALAAAISNRCGLLVFAGKPGCAVCETVWGKLYNGMEMMDGAGKMAAYLKSNKLVGLKIDDSQSHFSDLAAGVMGYRNSDGTATNTNAPFLALVKVKDTGKPVAKLTLKNANVEVFFGGYGSLVIADKTYAKIAKWLDGLLGSAKYRNAFPEAATVPAETPTAPAVQPAVPAGAAGKWYYHSSAKNETAKAVQAALDNNCGLLVVVGKPNCSTCAKAWGKSYMDGDGKLQKYLKDHKLVGLKIDDSQSHAQSIGSGLGGYTNYDKSKADKNVPFLLLVKPKAGVKTFETIKKKTSIDQFFGGFGSKTISGQTYPVVAAWLDLLLDPKLSYYDKRDNYATVYGNLPAVKERTYKVTADLSWRVHGIYQAASAAEAEEMACRDAKKAAIDMPPGWADSGEGGKAKMTIEEME